MKKSIKKHLSKQVPAHISWSIIAGYIIFSVSLVALLIISINKANSSLDNVEAHYDHPNPSDWPTTGYISTGAHTHYGGGHAIDIAPQPAGTHEPIYATTNGRVEIAGVDGGEPGCGIKVRIRSTNGGIADYCHLSSANVLVNSDVRYGQLIGNMGNTGTVDRSGGGDGTHLHYWLSQPQYFPAIPCVGGGCNVSSASVASHQTVDAPSLTRVTHPACSDVNYGFSGSGNLVKIEWTGRERMGSNAEGGFWVDIDDTNPMSGPSNRNINPGSGVDNNFVTTGSDRIWVEAKNGGSGVGGTTGGANWFDSGAFGGITFQPNKVYYTKIWNGVDSNVKYWNVPRCSQNNTFDLGDANCSGSVTSADATVILQYVVSGELPLGCSFNNFFANANVNGSAAGSYPTVNTVDAALILQYISGLITRFNPAVGAAGQVDTDGDELFDSLEDSYPVLNKFVNDSQANPDGDAQVNAGEIVNGTNLGVYDVPLPENTLQVQSTIEGYLDPGISIERADGTGGVQGTTNYQFKSTNNINTLLRVPSSQFARPDGDTFYRWIGCDSIVGGTPPGAITGNECWVSLSGGETRIVYADYIRPPLNTLNVQSTTNGSSDPGVLIEYAAGTSGTGDTTDYAFNTHSNYNTLLRVPSSQFARPDGDTFYRWIGCDSIVGGTPPGAITGNECWVSGSGGSNKTVKADYKSAVTPSPSPTPSPTPTPPPVETIPAPVANVSCPAGQSFGNSLAIGGVLNTAASIENIGNHLVIAATGSDSNVYVKERRSDGTFRDWYNLSGTTPSQVKLAFVSGTLRLYLQGYDGWIYRNNYISEGSWAGWVNTGVTNASFGTAGPTSTTTTSIGTFRVTGLNPPLLENCVGAPSPTPTPTPSPAAIPNPAANATCPAGQSFGNTTSIGGVANTPMVLENISNHLVIVGTGSDDWIYVKERRADGTFRDWYGMGGNTPSQVKLVFVGPTLRVYLQGYDGWVYRNDYVSEGVWAGFVNTGVTNAGFGTAGPTAVATTSIGTYRTIGQNPINLENCVSIPTPTPVPSPTPTPTPVATPPPTFSITLAAAQKICDVTNERVRLTWTENIGTSGFDIYRSDLGYYTNNSSVGDFWEGPVPESGSFNFKVRNHDWNLTGGGPIESNEVTISINQCVGVAGTVISTELFRQDAIAEDVWRGDVIFGKQTAVASPNIMEGYHFWARPVVNLMQKSQLFSSVVKFIATPVLTQIAHEAGTVDNGSLVGNIILESGKTVSGTIGYFVDEPAYTSASR